MDWVVEISAGETAGGALAPETEAAAHAAFREHGCALLRGMFPPATVEAMHQEYLAQFGTLDKAAMGVAAERPAPNRFLAVGDARFDITPRITGAFGRPDVFANPRLLKLLGPQLGSEIHLSNFTVVVSHPGSPPQHIHRDLGHLFPEGAGRPTEAKPSIRQAGARSGATTHVPAARAASTSNATRGWLARAELDPGSSQASPFSFAGASRRP
jgi:hypothetical protein